MNALDFALLSAAALVAVPVTVLAGEAAVALLVSRKRRANSAASPRPPLAVLIPAHNEELHIAATVHSVQKQLHPHDRLLVVADNCTDSTADRARAAGAEVLIREHETQRGKGFALAAGMEFLSQDPRDFVVLLDADTTLSARSLDFLIDDAARLNAPVQAVYVLEPPVSASTKDRISAFAFAFKNHVRGVGAEAFGIPCLLRGTGMAFPWSVLSSAKLATSNIVEDMQLGIELAIAGQSPRFCSEAMVTGSLPDKAGAATTQRTRWEHGHLQTILHNVPTLVWQGIRQVRPGLWALALDVAVPPLTLLAMVWAVITAAAAAFFGLGFASYWPASVLLAIGLVLMASILFGWARYAQNVLPLSTLLRIPFYIAWKIPLYFGFIFKRQRAWVRTAR